MFWINNDMWFGNAFCINVSKMPSRKKLAAYKNNQAFQNAFFDLMDVATIGYMERMEAVSPTVNLRLIIQSLIAFASVAFFRNDDNGGILSLAGTPSGKGWNIYGDPLSAWVFSRNGTLNKQIDLFAPGSDTDAALSKSFASLDTPPGREQGFLLYDNQNRYPVLEYIIYYAAAIADTMRTIDVARKWLKMPSIPVCEQSLLESVRDTFNKIDDNAEIIPVSSGMQTIDKFTLMPAGDATKNITSATALCDWYTQQFREKCGLKNNAAIDKKGENLLTDEVNINTETAEDRAAAKWDYIRQQVELLNKFFGEEVLRVKDEQPTHKQVVEQEDGNDDDETNI